MEEELFNTLIKRIAEKDKFALEEIYYQYGKMIKWTGYYVIGDWNYAEDIINIVLIKLWNGASEFGTIKYPNTWMYKFAKNTAIDFYRSNIEKHKSVLSIDIIQPDLNNAYWDDYSHMNFLENLSSLDNLSREIIILRLEVGLTFKEISKQLKIPQGTIAWKYRNALETLKNELEEKSIN